MYEWHCKCWCSKFGTVGLHKSYKIKLISELLTLRCILTFYFVCSVNFKKNQFFGGSYQIWKEGLWRDFLVESKNSNSATKKSIKYTERNLNEELMRCRVLWLHGPCGICSKASLPPRSSCHNVIGHFLLQILSTVRISRYFVLKERKKIAPQKSIFRGSYQIWGVLQEEFLVGSQKFGFSDPKISDPKKDVYLR